MNDTSVPESRASEGSIADNAADTDPQKTSQGLRTALKATSTARLKPDVNVDTAQRLTHAALHRSEMNVKSSKEVHKNFGKIVDPEQETIQDTVVLLCRCALAYSAVWTVAKSTNGRGRILAFSIARL